MNSYVALAMEEYKAIRAEIIQTMSNQQSILSFGMAALGIAVAAGASTWQDRVAPVILFLHVVPLLGILIVVLWAGEFLRMVLAGSFMAELETRINEESGLGPALTWESGGPRLRRHSSRRAATIERIQRMTVILLFGLLSTGSIILGELKAFASLSPTKVAWANVGLTALVIAGVVLAGIRFDLANHLLDEREQEAQSASGEPSSRDAQ